MFIKIEDQPEAEEVMEFLSVLGQEEKKGFLMFLNGAKFMKSIEDAKVATGHNSSKIRGREGA